jgi:hypothetical protein
MSTESGTRLSVLVKVDLDWSAPDHWDAEHAKPCRVCGTNTKSRDKDLAVHQSCREDEIARELLGRAYALIDDERFAGQPSRGTEVAR